MTRTPPEACIISYQYDHLTIHNYITCNGIMYNYTNLLIKQTMQFSTSYFMTMYLGGTGDRCRFQSLYNIVLQLPTVYVRRKHTQLSCASLCMVQHTQLSFASLCMLHHTQLSFASWCMGRYTTQLRFVVYHQ